MRTPIRHLAPLLPHAGNMILLDEITTYSDTHLQGLARIGPDHLFLDEQQQLPMWCGIEIMAQAVAAFAGCQAHDAGLPVKLGFLLGSREVTILRASVPAGSVLRVQVEASTRDEATGFGVFDCSLALLEKGEAGSGTAGDATTSTRTASAGATDAETARGKTADRDNATPVATARLSVFSPPDIDHYLQEQAV